jgi:hypothetical protein
MKIPKTMNTPDTKGATEGNCGQVMNPEQYRNSMRNQRITPNSIIITPVIGNGRGIAYPPSYPPDNHVPRVDSENNSPPVPLTGQNPKCEASPCG